MSPSGIRGSSLAVSSRSYAVNALAPPASYTEAVRAHWTEYLMEAAEFAPSDLAIWHRLMRDVPFAPHNLALLGGGLLKFRRSVNTHALSDSPTVRRS